LAKSATKQRRNAEAHYALVAAEAGKVVCDPDWGDESKRAELLTDARSAFLNALKTDVTPGAVRDMRRDLGLILWAGGEELSQWAGGVYGLMGKLRPVGGREEYDPWSIDSLELSEQTRNVLKAAYVYTVSQAATMDDEQLLAIDGIGDIRLQELKDSINALG
jgi:hypothetical protein